MVAGMVAGEGPISPDSTATSNPELVRLIDRWPALPAHVRQTILMLAESAADAGE